MRRPSALTKAAFDHERQTSLMPVFQCFEARRKKPGATASLAIGEGVIDQLESTTN